MKYIWMIILVIAYVIWGVYAVKDLIYCIKYWRHPLSILDESSAAFFAISIIIILALRNYLWVNIHSMLFENVIQKTLFCGRIRTKLRSKI